jgi:hypothetical protein
METSTITKNSTVTRYPEDRVPTRSKWPPKWMAQKSEVAIAIQVPSITGVVEPLPSASAPAEQVPSSSALLEPSAIDDCPFEFDQQPIVDEWDFWWSQMEPADVAYAREPLGGVKPCCPWCHHRGCHTPECEALHDEWSMPLPWGTHKGVLVRRAPRDLSRMDVPA